MLPPPRADPGRRSSSRSSMWMPIVTSARPSAARIADVICDSHRRASSRCAGTTQFEFSLPRSQAHNASCPATTSAARRANSAWRPHDVVVEVPVPQAVLDDATARHDPEPCVAFRTTERPSRDPIDAAHMPREQRRHHLQAGGTGDVRHGDQALEHLGIDVVGLGLERLPQQEYAHRVEPRGGDPLEVPCGLRLVERRPPPHRGAGRPIVDAEPERLRCIDAGRHGRVVRPTTRR